MQEPSESTPTISLQLPSQVKGQGSKDKGKAKMIEPDKPLKKKDHIKFDEEEALRLQAEFDEEDRLAREKAQQVEEANIAWDDIQAKIDAYYQLAEKLQAQVQQELTIKENSTLFLFDKAIKRINTFVDIDTELVEGSKVRAEGSKTRAKGSSKREGDEIEQESTKKQKMDDDKEIAELQRLIEVVPDKEEVAIDAIPLATKPPSIVDYKIHKEGKKTYYQIIRAHGSLKMYLVFSHMLKNFNREDLETLWKLVKAKHGSTRPEEGYERVL
ncbi:hypothetical protein Tco_1212264 [Tanacetum coccineum]